MPLEIGAVTSNKGDDMYQIYWDDDGELVCLEFTTLEAAQYVWDDLLYSCKKLLCFRPK